MNPSRYAYMLYVSGLLVLAGLVYDGGAPIAMRVMAGTIIVLAVFIPPWRRG